MKRVFMMVSLVAVSVPSRGAIFLNTMLKGLFALVLAGFRPLSGSYIS